MQRYDIMSLYYQYSFGMVRPMVWGAIFIYILLISSATATETPKTPLVSAFLCKLRLFLPNWLSQRIRIIYPKEALLASISLHSNDSVHKVYKILSHESFIAVSSLNETEKIDESVELRIFPFPTNVFEACNMYTNHGYYKYHYYLIYVDNPDNISASLENCPI